MKMPYKCSMVLETLQLIQTWNVSSSLWYESFLGALPQHWGGVSYHLLGSLVIAQIELMGGCLISSGSQSDSCYGYQQVVSLRCCCWQVDWEHHWWMAGCVCAWYCLSMIHSVSMENLPQLLQCGVMHLWLMLCCHLCWTLGEVLIENLVS